ncbi:ATP-grasp domain-containing protein [Paenarthrobacter nitroguajacolicus]|uniref:ATP-grasp domain-containing protein n=1 Tax=Paenarthrobacter nitroguajacolicus TaxID=211146 RepID=UPI003AE75040
MARVLVTGIAGPAGSSLARQLKSKGHWVLGADEIPVRRGSADAMAIVSPATAPGYLWELRGLVATYGIEVLIPTMGGELVVVSEARDDFAPGVRVVVAEPAPVKTANDKYFTMACLAGAGVRVPGFGLPSVLGSVQDAMDLLGGPLVVKPRVSHGGRGVRLLERTFDGGARAARIWATLDDSWVVQRYAPGTEYASVGLRCRQLTGPDDVLVVLEKTASEKARAGASPALRIRKVRPFADPDVAELAASAVAALGLTGPLTVDIRRLQDGTPAVLEVEARFGTYSAHAPQLLDNVLDCYVGSRLLGKSA